MFSVDNQKLLQKIVEELESLKGETEILSIAASSASCQQIAPVT
jgi:hypothetical protein